MVKTIQVFQNVGGINFIKIILFERIGKGINIVDHISTIVNNIEIDVAVFYVLTATKI
jgi:hypothetical protein